MVLVGKEFPPVFGVKRIESHLTWIQCNIPYIEESAIREMKTMEDYVLSLNEEENRNQLTDGVVAKEGQVARRNPKLEAGDAPERLGHDHEADIDGEDEADDTSSISSTIGYFALKLNFAAMRAYVSDFEVAEVKLAEARKLLKDLAEDHQDAGLYCVEALQYSIAILKNKDAEIEDAEFIAADRKLQLNDKTTIAVITFLKGCLAVALKVPDEEVLLMFERAAKLDPDCYIWNHYVFRKLRRIRRFQRFMDHADGPCPKEEYYCKTAYELRPTDDYVTLVDYALLLKDGLWGRRSAVVWDEQMDKVVLCVELFKDALQRAKEKKSDEWSIKKIKMYLADFLVFGKSQWLDQQEGKNLLDECVKDYPSSSVVFHKAGKFYCYGMRGSQLHQDFEKGKAYLLKGLECCPRNFPCLMDYIKLLEKMNEIPEVLATIDKYSNLMKRDHQVGKLQIMRGCIVWQEDPFNNPQYKREASDSWLLVLEKYPKVAEELYTRVKRLYCRDFNNNNNRKFAYEDRVRLIEHLESRKPEFAGDRSKAMKLQAFINELQTEKKDDGLDWSSIRCPRAEQENPSVENRFRCLSVSSSESNETFYTVYSQQSQSQCGGWRRPPQVDFNGNIDGHKRPQEYEVYRPPQLSTRTRQWSNSVADADGDWRRKN